MPTPGEMVAQQAPQGMPPQGGQAPMGAPMEEQVNVSNEMNPVLDAFRTLTSFVIAKSEAGDPNAPAMQGLLQQFVQLLAGEQGASSGESMMAPPPPQEQASQGMGNMGKVPMMGRGVDTMRGASAGARAQTGQIPVI